MTTWNPYEPCSVGDLRLPPKFEPIWYLLYCNTKVGHPTRAWLHLPGEMSLSLNCETDHSEEIELWRFGPLTLTRPMTESEQEEYWYDYDPTP